MHIHSASLLQPGSILNYLLANTTLLSGGPGDDCVITQRQHFAGQQVGKRGLEATAEDKYVWPVIIMRQDPGQAVGG